MRTQLFAATIAVAVVCCHLPAAAEQPPSPTDTCLARAQTTADMIFCADQEYQNLDQELNRIYKALLKVTSPPQALQLKEAQRRWLAFRDAEFKAMGSVYDTMDGTIYRVIRAGHHNQVVRDRVEQLAALLEAMAGEDVGPDAAGKPRQ